LGDGRNGLLPGSIAVEPPAQKHPNMLHLKLQDVNSKTFASCHGTVLLQSFIDNRYDAAPQSQLLSRVPGKKEMLYESQHGAKVYRHNLFPP
jgi:hypothetical protein